MVILLYHHTTKCIGAFKYIPIDLSVLSPRVFFRIGGDCNNGADCGSYVRSGCEECRDVCCIGGGGCYEYDVLSSINWFMKSEEHNINNTGIRGIRARRKYYPVP